MSRPLLRTGALLLLVLALVSCSETPPVSPTPEPTPTPSSPTAEAPTIERSLSDYLTGVGVGAEIGTLGYDPEFAEIFDAMQLRNEWVEVSRNIYHWGTSVDGQTGAGARVSRVSVAEFDAAVVGSARSCATLIEENVQVAGIYEIGSFTLFGRPGRSFIEGYGDGAIRGACTDLPDSILLVEVTDPLFVTVSGSSRLAAQEILAAIAAGRDPFSGAFVE